MKRAALALLFSLAAIGAATARPSAWCGWYARTLAPVRLGNEYNLACQWLHYGRPTNARVGAFVIWCGRHHRHVGLVTRIDANGNVTVKSGNDGHAVRERIRSVAGAVFRI